MAQGMRERRPRAGVGLFKLAGIEVKLHYSWLVIFVLVVWSLSAGYLPRTFPGQSREAYWLAGVFATILFFLSVLVHELCHSLMAKHSGLAVSDITLFVFGGVSRITEEAKDPRTELLIAIVGPLSSFVLALLFWGVRAAVWDGDVSLVGAIIDRLAWANLALGVFNLIPGFPLDGGRVLRAIVWWKTGSLNRATRWASDIGKSFAVALMVLGAVQIFAGALIGGLWLIFIGIFLKGVAEGSYQQTVMRQSLEGVLVRDVMVEDVVSVPPEMKIKELVQKYFLHYGYKAFPVLDRGRVIGVVALANVKHLTEEEQEVSTVGQVMIDFDDAMTIDPEASLADALTSMARHGTERLLVMEGAKLIGLITKTGLHRFVEIKQVLEH